MEAEDNSSEVRSLDEQLDRYFSELGVPDPIKRSARELVDPFKIHHLPTWKHLVRCGLLGKRVGEYLQNNDYSKLSPKALFFSCLLHDRGKMECSPFILSKLPEDFDEEDMAHVKRHVLEGYRDLRAQFPFSAEALLDHHKHQRNDYGYPESLPKPVVPCSGASQDDKEFCSTWVAIVDSYESSISRVRKGRDAPLGSGEAKLELLEKFPEQAEMIEGLYNAGVLD